MIKFKIVLSDKTIEFATKEEALAFKQANNLSEEIESFEEVIAEGFYVPEQVTPRQIKLALLRSGYNLSTIQSFILSLSEPQASEVLIWWNEATTFDRSNSVLNEVAPQMGFTQKDLDELFIFASAL